MSWVDLELRHLRCVCNVKLQCKEVKNTTSLLSVNSVVNRTTCFGLLGGHHQVQQVLAIGDRYTGCPRRHGQNFGRVFLMLKYTDITQNTHIQSWTVTEIMAREVWKYDSCYTFTDYQIHIKTGRNMWFL